MINQSGLEGNILNLIKGIYTENPTAQDFPDGPVVKNLPYNAKNMGSIPGQGAKIPHATEQLSLCATTTEPLHSK